MKIWKHLDVLVWLVVTFIGISMTHLYSIRKWHIQDFPLGRGAPTSDKGAFRRKHMQKRKNWVPLEAPCIRHCIRPESLNDNFVHYLWFPANHPTYENNVTIKVSSVMLLSYWSLLYFVWNLLMPACFVDVHCSNVDSQYYTSIIHVITLQIYTSANMSHQKRHKQTLLGWEMLIFLATIRYVVFHRHRGSPSSCPLVNPSPSVSSWHRSRFHVWIIWILHSNNWWLLWLRECHNFYCDVM